MPANMNATSTCDTAAQVEFEFPRESLVQFADALAKMLNGEPQTKVYHLQVQRSGVAPGPAAPAPIRKWDPVTISIHRFQS